MRSLDPITRRPIQPPAPLAGALVAVLILASAAWPQEGRPGFAWNAERAEHLWNRAGFGAAPEEIEHAVALGLEGFVAELLAGEPWLDEPFYARIRGASRDDREPMMEDGMDMGMQESRRERVADLRREDGQQLRDYMSWWSDRMVEGADPLRERMTLFWHGHFTSSMQDVKNSHEMIVQNQLLRRNATGSFRDLVHAIARDPAMLEYLDNDSNRRGSPNENFARELMELFTLGEGNYSEDDVKQAARAFTGWTDRRGRFLFEPRRHDYGEKTVLGITGRLDGDDVIEILLDQEACPRYLAGKLLRYFEGVEPDAERLAHYAELMGEVDYRIADFLAELFTDTEFYRPEVIGTRISGPIDYVVGSARRLGLEPPSELVLLGGQMLGQRLFFPPNVKGWEGGQAWITTASLMNRGNLTGVMLGQVSLDDFLSDEELAMDAALATQDYGEMEAMSGDELPSRRELLGSADRSLRELRGLERRRWRPRLNLTATLQRVGARSDREVVGELTSRLLALPLDADAREKLALHLGAEREARRIAEGRLLDYGVESEQLLRRFAHLIVSLPEAQLH